MPGKWAYRCGSELVTDWRRTNDLIHHIRINGLDPVYIPDDDDDDDDEKAFCQN